ncbi:MAG: hypothetical protein IKI66_08205 [Bacteroidales bacterium]|nr:hypothetical protein [Bacteroidales bacterium]
MIRKILIGLILLVVTSLYLFPIEFTFLPKAINSKILVAAFGSMAFVFDSIKKKAMELSQSVLVSMLLAIIFSIWCLFSVTVANTYEMDYATYIVSFLTWMAGAYGVYAALKIAYGEVDLWLLTRYLALVGVFQCVSAVMIDNNQSFCDLVDRFVVGGSYYREHGRIYGIGAALDPAGIRFSTILVLLAHQFSFDQEVRSKGLYQTTDMIAFAVILIIGSTISRTTIVGGAMGIVYMVISLVRLRQGGFITTRMIQVFFIFIVVLVGIILSAVYFYRTSATFESYLRFGFEAFFNWAETGEFRTSSTDQLGKMWVWPDDTRTWIIGRGTYGVFENNTDIGYCNFTFYCGLIGLAIFSLFFIYVHMVQNRKFHHFWVVSLMLVAITFIVWCKVTTDIFYLDALLFCIAADSDEEEDVPELAEVET